MPRTCTICTHPDRSAIDAALIAGEPFRNIAERHGVSVGAFFRYKSDRLPASLVHAKQANKAAHADDLLDQVRDLRQRTLAILDSAEKAGDRRTALAAIREARGCIELFGRLAGELQQNQTVNIALSGEWQQIRGVILTALHPFPQARGAVVDSLLALEASHEPDR